MISTRRETFDFEGTTYEVTVATSVFPPDPAGWGVHRCEGGRPANIVVMGTLDAKGIGLCCNFDGLPTALCDQAKAIALRLYGTL